MAITVHCFVATNPFLQTIVKLNGYSTLSWASIFLLHGPSMLPDKAKFVECSIISLALSFWMKHLVFGQ